MALISRKLLKRRPQELGKIKIGKLGAARTGSGGKEYRLPEKLDCFLITTRHRGADGNFVRDAVIHERVGANPTELRGVLMFETPQENFHAEMTQYSGRTKVVSCNGEEANDLRNGSCFACPRAGGRACPKIGATPACKPYGRLHLQLLDSPNTLGFHVFRTTSWESVNNIQTALQEIYERFGTLYSAPVRLVVYPSEDRYTDGGAEKVSTSQKVGLVLAMSMEEAATLMVESKRHLELAKNELKMISGAVQEDLVARDVEEMEEVALEFFPDSPAAVNASIETQDRFEELKAELGLAPNDEEPPEIEAEFEIEGADPEADEAGGPDEGEAPAMATEKQLALIEKLVRSSVFTDKERDQVRGRVLRGMPKAEASAAIEWLTDELKGRKAEGANDNDQEDDHAA